MSFAVDGCLAPGGLVPEGPNPSRAPRAPAARVSGRAHAAICAAHAALPLHRSQHGADVGFFLLVLPFLVALALLTLAPEAAAAPAVQKARATAPAPRSKARPKARAPTPLAERAPPRATPPSPVEAPRVVAGAKPDTPAADVTKTEEARAGEKTYTFGAQEVEGRLKSPQILYFLRRVRAQFDPAPLGHRSFLLELSDTRRHPALE